MRNLQPYEVGMPKKKSGLYLDERLLAQLDDIATELEISRNAVVRLACRLLVKRWKTGELDVRSYFGIMNERYDTEK